MIASVLFLVGFDVRSGLAFNSTCYFPPYTQSDSDIGSPAPGNTPCSQNSNDEASPCCGYSDGSICLSNGLCFVPANNTMMQGTCTDPTWSSSNCPNPSHRCTDSNLRVCDSTAGDIPAPGDAGGWWYCGNQTQSCNDIGKQHFGIDPGFFADFRNFSSSSAAATSSTKPTAKVPSSSVTTDSTAAVTATPRTAEPSCPTQTDTKHTFSSGDIAAIVLGAVCAVLIAIDIYILFFRRRSSGSPDAIQRPIEAEQNSKEVGELDGNLRIGGPIRELPASRNSHVELQ
ncbi:hypothetical protein BDR22DRAFT_823991 [Usnea florida]